MKRTNNFVAAGLLCAAGFLSLAFPPALLSQQHASPMPAVQREQSLGISAGMGVNVVRAAGVVDYINSTALFSQRVDDWGTAVNFFGGIEIPIGSEWNIKFEHSYLFKSYSFIGTNGGTYDLFYSSHSPSILLQRVVSGKGYFVKFGAGGGPHFGSVKQDVSLYGTSSTYRSSGFGLLCELSGQTAFDDHLYGYIGGVIAGEFLGTIGTGKSTVSSDPSEVPGTVRLNSFSAGLQFGISYYF
ncbi:MAG: hypothetical protein WCT99_13800 [Bacteroidota bacterium]|jgi:hypothetical protein